MSVHIAKELEKEQDSRIENVFCNTNPTAAKPFMKNDVVFAYNQCTSFHIL